MKVFIPKILLMIYFLQSLVSIDVFARTININKEVQEKQWKEQFQRDITDKIKLFSEEMRHIEALSVSDLKAELEKYAGSQFVDRIFSPAESYNDKVSAKVYLYLSKHNGENWFKFTYEEINEIAQTFWGLDMAFIRFIMIQNIMVTNQRFDTWSEINQDASSPYSAKELLRLTQMAGENIEFLPILQISFTPNWSGPIGSKYWIQLAEEVSLYNASQTEKLNFRQIKKVIEIVRNSPPHSKPEITATLIAELADAVRANDRNEMDLAVYIDLRFHTILPKSSHYEAMKSAQSVHNAREGELKKIRQEKISKIPFLDR